MKLLIVDDSLIVRNTIERNVRHAEITEILQADNGILALQLFNQHHPELVTMDLTMPHLDGIACLQEIQKNGPPASIMVISAINSHRTAMDAVARGACGFLVKPFTPPELIEAMNDLILHAKENGYQYDA
ncbi:MAG: response regulator [Methylacidiphilales bacterium]|nr:response regulator [Candidatus Methylacidiphilales bacterium]